MVDLKYKLAYKKLSFKLIFFNKYELYIPEINFLLKFLLHHTINQNIT